MSEPSTPTPGPATGGAAAPVSATPPGAVAGVPGAASAARPSGSRRSRLLRRTAWSVGGVLGALVLAVLLAEWAGWPFLSGPMQSTLTKALHRPVYLEGRRVADAAPAGDSASAPRSASGPAPVPRTPDAASGDRVAGGVRVKLFGRVEVRAQRIEIGPPPWQTDGPPMLVADDARLQLRYRDLWRAYKGGALRVRRIEAERLDVRLLRLADGRASWQFGPPKPPQEQTKEPAAMPVFEDLRVRDGRMVLRDAQFESAVDARFALVDGAGMRRDAVGPDGRVAHAAASAARPASGASGASGTVATDGDTAGLRAEATGRYRGMPLRVSLRTVGVLPWVSDEAVSRGVPFVIDGSIGRARLKFDGFVRDIQNLAGLGGAYVLSGPALSAVGDVLGVTLPTTPAFTLHGQIEKQGEVWTTRVEDARIGRSRLKAELRYDRSLPKPLLAGRVGGPRLLLADLGPAIGTPPTDLEGTRVAPPKVAAPGRVLPDREFDLPSLRAMNADVAFELAELDLGSERLQPLRPMKARLLLQDGLLTLRDIDARTADGNLRGELSLDGRQTVAVYRTDLRWNEVQLEKWLQQERSRDQPPFVAGRFDGSAKLQGRGRSTAQILASLDGDLRGRLRNGSISHLIVEAAGLDLAQALGVFVKGDAPLPLNCALADLQVRSGTARPRVMVIDSRDSVVWVEGAVSLADERLDLRAVVSPRDFSPVSLRTPVRVRGTLNEPAVSVQPGPLVGKLGAAALLGTLVNPLAALLPLIDFGSKDTPPAEGGCQALIQRVQQTQQAKARAG